MNESHDPDFTPAHPIFDITPEERLLIWGVESKVETERRQRTRKAPQVQPRSFDNRDPESMNPERWFRAGRNLLEKSDFTEAIRALQRALDLAPERPLYCSYFGLALALNNRSNGREGVALCEQAARRDRRPETLLNLGRAYLTSGRRKKAFKAFEQGLAINRADPDLRYHIQSMGIRRSPPIPFLPRGHRLNILAGRTLKAVGLR